MDGNGSSTGTYLWTTSDGNIVSGSTTLNPTIDLPGTYQLQVTGSNGCMATNSITVSENMNLPVSDPGTADPIGCATTSVSLNGNGSSSGGNFSYLWTTSNGNILNGNTTLNPSVDAAGTYTLLVTNNDNGCTAQNSITVIEVLTYQ